MASYGFFQRFLGVSGILFLMNILFYAYQLLLTRGLSVASYGNIGSLLAWTVLASIPSTAISMFLIRYITLHSDDLEKQTLCIRSVFTSLIRWTPLSFFLILISGFFLTPWFHLSFFTFFLILVVAYMTVFLSLFRAILYARGELKRYAINLFFEIAIRIALTLPLLFISQDILLLYGMYALSVFAALVFFRSDIRDACKKGTDTVLTHLEVIEMRSHLLPVVIVSIVLTCIGSIEMVVARYLLPADDIGKLGALIMIGKLVLAGLGIFVAVGTPYFSDTQKNKKNIILLYLGMLMSSIIAFLCFAFLGGWIVDIMFPSGYDDIVPYLIPMAIVMSIISLLTMLVQHASIAGKRSAGYLSPIILVSLLVSLFLSASTFSGFVSGMLWGHSMGTLLWALSFFIVFLYQSKKSSL